MASIFSRNGSLNWRQVFEQQTVDDVGQINAISGDLVGELVTISGNGRYVRSWDPDSGLLNSEVSLPEDFLIDE